MSNFSELFEARLGKSLRLNVPLADYASFQIGGPTDYFFEAVTPEELKAAVGLARQHRLRFYVMGSGTNLLFDDDGYRGLIIKNAARGLSVIPGSPQLEVQSGTRLSNLVEFAVSQGLKGLEFLAGIPGTVGGAVFGNAGAFGRSIGDCLAGAVLFDRTGQSLRVGPEYFAFSYRRSSLRQDQAILLQSTFGLEPGDEKRMREDVACFLSQRKARHPPLSTACAGCYFKNPVLPDGTRMSAGKILEEVGAKGLSRGGAAVSPTHGNFIINQGGARAADVLSLAGELKHRVRERYGVDMEEEVIFLPATASMP